MSAGSHDPWHKSEPSTRATSQQSDVLQGGGGSAGSSAKSLTDINAQPGGGNLQDVYWEKLLFGRQIWPQQGHAHCSDDVCLLSCFLGLAQVRDIDGDSVKLLLRTLKLLRLCEYSAEDICSVLAHASAYFNDAYELCGEHMDPSEVGHVLASLVFVAHCYVQDETCPLRVWHQHLFRKYCPLSVLNAAIIRLLEIRAYVLRLDSEDLTQRFRSLIQAVLDRNATEDTKPTEAPGGRGAGAAGQAAPGGGGGRRQAAEREQRGRRQASAWDFGDLRECLGGGRHEGASSSQRSVSELDAGRGRRPAHSRTSGGAR